MYSCNVPVPPELSRLARGLANECFDATARDRHTLVVKRLGDGTPANLTRRIRSALAGFAPFEARASAVDVFRTPPVGRGPVAYLRVDAPPILEMHHTLCETFEPIDGIEGDDYVPHVTIARGGDADRLTGREFESITWTVNSLLIWSADYGETVERLSLPI